jgi:riboflavin kinase/FMN adenylyltransferase
MTDTLTLNLQPSVSGPRIATIGSFDGVHRGHQLLLQRAVARARELEGRSLVLTFEPLPAQVLRPDKFNGRICTAEEKLERLHACGTDEIAVIPFDRELSRQSPETFMSWLNDETGLSELWVGEAFALGKDRVGDVSRLNAIGKELGFDVIAVSREMDGGDVVSSSAIRQAILGGDVKKAHRLLGRPFRVTGEVMHGAHLGRTIGYPTANVPMQESIVPLADGIYASLTRVPGHAEPLPGMTYVGTRPTVNTGARCVETNIFDFSGDLYGQVIETDVYERLRGDEVFDGLEALIAQLGRDEIAARSRLQTLDRVAVSD